MTAQVFSNRMVAHVWAQGRQESGRSNNGNFYFSGPFLYSYGLHYVAGYRLPDGQAFLNADSYSVTTGHHMSCARGAVAGRKYSVPNLTGLAPLLDKATRRAKPGVFPAEYEAAPRKEARAVLPAIRRHFVTESELASPDAIQAALTVAGAKPAESESMARAIAEEHARRADKAKERRHKATRDRRAARAKDYARRPVSETVSRIQSYVNRGHRFQACHAEREFSEEGRRLLRAVKEAKARGWTRIAKEARAHYDAIRAEIAQFEMIEIRRNRLAWFGKQAGLVKAGLAALSRTEEQKRGFDWRQEAMAARGIVEKIRLDPETGRPGWLRPRVTVAGADPLRLVETLESIAAQFDAMAVAADEKETREGWKRDIAALRAFRAMQGDCRTCHGVGELAPLSRCSDCSGTGAAGPVAAEERAEIAHKAAIAAGHYAPLPYSGNTLRPMPPAFRVAGFSPKWFKETEEAARAAQEREERAAFAEERDAWREGRGPLPRRRPYAGGNRGATVTKDGHGGAMLRALHVIREDSGAITGGTLETSQGATVPLTHALRAFRFLRHCRATGKGWRANGRTLRVGHFRIDSVDPQGNFRAGCHRINYAECAALAERLGVADLAPADITEERETA